MPGLGQGSGPGNSGQKRITSVFGSRVLGSKRQGEWKAGTMEPWPFLSPNTPTIQYSIIPIAEPFVAQGKLSGAKF